MPNAATGRKMRNIEMFLSVWLLRLGSLATFCYQTALIALLPVTRMGNGHCPIWHETACRSTRNACQAAGELLSQRTLHGHALLKNALRSNSLRRERHGSALADW